MFSVHAHVDIIVIVIITSIIALLLSVWRKCSLRGTCGYEASHRFSSSCCMDTI